MSPGGLVAPGLPFSTAGFDVPSSLEAANRSQNPFTPRQVMASCTAVPAGGVRCQGRAAAASRPQRSSWAPRVATAVPQQQQRRRQRRSVGAAAAADDGPVGVIIECDGALVDAHVTGHMEAFNRAFSVSTAAVRGGCQRPRLAVASPPCAACCRLQRSRPAATQCVPGEARHAAAAASAAPACCRRLGMTAPTGRPPYFTT